MKKTFAITMRILILFVLLVTAVGLSTKPASAAISIPADATITSAVLTLNYIQGYKTTISVHNVTASWDEMSVTWDSFQNAFDPTVVNTFTPSVDFQLISVDVLSLVEGWKVGTPNNGLLLRVYNELPFDYYFDMFYNREAGLGLAPKLTVCYTAFTGPNCVEEAAIADTSVWEIYPQINYGADTLYVRKGPNNTNKYILIKFDLTSEPPSGPGTGTPGYWKNHSWPVDSIVIGGKTYTRDQAIAIMLKVESSGDKTYTMFNALVAAELNKLMGTNTSCVEPQIADAQTWMAIYTPGSGVEGKSPAWKIGEPIAKTLDDYNNGLLCAPPRD